MCFEMVAVNVTKALHLKTLSAMLPEYYWPRIRTSFRMAFSQIGRKQEVNEQDRAGFAEQVNLRDDIVRSWPLSAWLPSSLLTRNKNCLKGRRREQSL